MLKMREIQELLKSFGQRAAIGVSSVNAELELLEIYELEAAFMTRNHL